jgi:CD63 antigen
MVQGGMKIVKYALFLVNLLFVVAGITLVTVGVMTTNSLGQFGTLIQPSELAVPSKLFIVVGVVVFIIAFLGCCGAVRENHCMMMTYSVLIALILILEVGASVASYYFADEVEEILNKGLTDNLKDYGQNTTQAETTRKTWDVVQSGLKCCGAHNYTDWFGVRLYNQSDNEFYIPKSCCIEDTDGCTEGITNTTSTAVVYTKLFSDGCVKKGVQDINIQRIGTVGITLAVLELLAVICACLMAKSIRYSYESV